MENQVTAIITIYNRVNYLDKQLESLIYQTKKINKFIFCVNNIIKKNEYDEIIRNNLDKDQYIIIEHSKNI
jgi:GT2 family glycosyltransferase